MDPSGTVDPPALFNVVDPRIRRTLLALEVDLTPFLLVNSSGDKSIYYSLLVGSCTIDSQCLLPHLDVLYIPCSTSSTHTLRL